MSGDSASSPLQSISEAEFERRTRRRLILFLSADIVNSTAAKQSLDDEGRQRWFGFVVTFVEAFPLLLRAKMEELSKKDSRECPSPSPWKLLGDEIIFAMDLGQRFEASICVSAFRNAVSEWNKLAQSSAGPKEGKLPVKGACWIAGFPVANAILATDGKGGAEDYVGPSMDAGFRVARLASKRRIAISVDLAWLLLDSGCFQLPIRYEHRAPVKGMDEDGYPFLWIPTQNSEFESQERDLLGHGKEEIPGQLKSLCDAWIREFGVPRFKPFIPSDDNLEETDPSYAALLLTTKQYLRDSVYFIDDDSAGGSAQDHSAERDLMLEQLPSGDQGTQEDESKGANSKNDRDRSSAAFG